MKALSKGARRYCLAVGLGDAHLLVLVDLIAGTFSGFTKIVQGCEIKTYICINN